MATSPGKRRPPEPGSAELATEPETEPETEPAAEPAEPVAPVLVGRVVGAWGVRGWVRVAPFNDPRLSLLLQLPRWFLRAPNRGASVGGAAPAGAGWRAVEVERVRVHGADEIVARLAGVDDRDAALALEGVEVFLERARFPAPSADEVYWADLIGCVVLDPDGAPLGTVVSIDDHPAHPVMRLSDAGRERLVPFVPELIRSVDLEARTVVADWRRDW